MLPRRRIQQKRHIHRRPREITLAMIDAERLKRLLGLRRKRRYRKQQRHNQRDNAAKFPHKQNLSDGSTSFVNLSVLGGSVLGGERSSPAAQRFPTPLPPPPPQPQSPPSASPEKDASPSAEPSPPPPSRAPTPHRYRPPARKDCLR